MIKNFTFFVFREMTKNIKKLCLDLYLVVRLRLPDELDSLSESLNKTNTTDTEVCHIYCDCENK